MIEMVYLNPNISKQQADELVKEGQELRENAYKELFKIMESLETDKQKADFLSLCLPILAITY